MISNKFFFIMLALFNGLVGIKVAYGLTGNKLFVFGDSYVDTGNTANPASKSGKPPYGMTYPGSPTGRWSDGRVWTDYIAQHLGLPSPVPYEQRDQTKNLNSGMNFAYGGTGVFDTLIPLPNMSKQINYFQQLISQGTYKDSHLKSSVALVAVSGNDITKFTIDKGGFATEQEWRAFQNKLVSQIIKNIKRLAGLGVKSIAVDSLQPLGCLPSAGFSFSSCTDMSNQRAIYQNNRLLSEMKALAKTDRNTNYYYLDLYTPWKNILNEPQFNPWNPPCCVGTGGFAKCGDTNGFGTPLYTVCSNPGSAFYWDTLHPAQRGWKEVYSKIKKPFKPL